MSDMAMLKKYFQYSDWANARVMAAARDLSAAQLDQPFDMGTGSLRTTLEHILVAEEVWLLRWKGTPEVPWPAEDPALSVGEMERRLKSNQNTRDDFIAGLSEAELAKVLRYRDSKGSLFDAPLGDMQLHVCDHSAHHRAQALNMLRRVGASPPDIGYMFWVRKPVPA